MSDHYDKHHKHDDEKHHHKDEKHHHKEEEHHHKEEKHHHHDEEYSPGRYGSQPSYGGDYEQSGGRPQAGYPGPYGSQPPYGGGYEQSGGRPQAGYPGSYGSQPPHGGGYAQSGGPAGYPVQYASSTTTIVQDSRAEAEKRSALEKSQKRNEHLAEFGALASGAFALYEQHQVKVDPENAQRHRIEETVAGVTALGAGGFAVYEHHQVSTERKEDAAANPDKHKHHGFFK